MSYEILYARKFIRLSDDTIIPLILSGSSNCTMFENGREIGERHWWILGGLLGKKEEDLFEWAQRYISKERETEWFKEGSQWITGTDIFRVLKNSVKRASTIEEILEANPLIHLSASISICDSSKNWGEKGYERREAEYSSLRTTKEIEKWVREVRKIEVEKKEEERVYFNMSFSTIKQLKPNVISKSLTGPVICCVRRGSYITEYNERSYTYNSRIEDALIFESVEAFRKSGLSERIHGYRLISGNIKPKNFAVEVSDGPWEGYYIQKLTAHRVYFTRQLDFAKKFEKEKDALAYIEKKLKSRISNMKEFKVKTVKESETR